MSNSLESDALTPREPEIKQSPELARKQELFLRSIMSAQLPKLQDEIEQTARDEATLGRALALYGADIVDIPEVTVKEGMAHALRMAFSHEYAKAKNEQRVEYILKLADQGDVTVSKRVEALLPALVRGYETIKKSIHYSTETEKTFDLTVSTEQAVLGVLLEEKVLDPITVLEIFSDTDDDFSAAKWKYLLEDQKRKVRSVLERLAANMLPKKVVIEETEDGPIVSIVEEE